MSSLLYLLSYSLVLFVFVLFVLFVFVFCFLCFLFCFLLFLLIETIEKVDADKGIAPLYSGHEPNMLLLHQSAFILKESR